MHHHMLWASRKGLIHSVWCVGQRFPILQMRKLKPRGYQGEMVYVCLPVPKISGKPQERPQDARQSGQGFICLSRDWPGQWAASCPLITLTASTPGEDAGRASPGLGSVSGVEPDSQCPPCTRATWAHLQSSRRRARRPPGLLSRPQEVMPPWLTPAAVACSTRFR